MAWIQMTGALNLPKNERVTAVLSPQTSGTALVFR